MTVLAQTVLPPLLVLNEIDLVLPGTPPATVKDWRIKSLKAVKAGIHDPGTHFPREDRFEDDRPFWYPMTIARWGVITGKLPQDHSLALPRIPNLWSQNDIANHFGVRINTVQERWRWFYVNAVSKNQTPPPKALPKEDFTFGGVLFWHPSTVIEWGKLLGKLGADGLPNNRSGLRWVAPEPIPDAPADPVQDAIQAGRLWDVPAIAEYFHVQPSTVKMWISPWAAGKNFPAPDGGRALDGTVTWLPQTVQAWGVKEKRVDAVTGEVRVSKGGFPKGLKRERTEMPVCGRPSVLKGTCHGTRKKVGDIWAPACVFHMTAAELAALGLPS